MLRIFSSHTSRIYDQNFKATCASLLINFKKSKSVECQEMEINDYFISLTTEPCMRYYRSNICGGLHKTTVIYIMTPDFKQKSMLLYNSIITQLISQMLAWH